MDVITSKLLGDKNYDSVLRELLDRVTALERRTAAVDQVGDLTDDLGTVTAGEFRAGSGEPGSGFTGVRMANPGVTYGGTDYAIAGVVNDTLQAGMTLAGGSLTAGAGNVVLDANGMNIALGTSFARTNAVNFINGSSVLAGLQARSSANDTRAQLYATDLIGEVYAKAENSGGKSAAELYLVAQDTNNLAQANLTTNGEIILTWGYVLDNTKRLKLANKTVAFYDSVAASYYDVIFPDHAGTVPVGTGAAGRVAFWSGTTDLSSNGGLLWDNTNQKLTVGDSASRTGYTLQVNVGAAQYPGAVLIGESAHATSKRTAVGIGSYWQIMQDYAGNGTRDLTIFDGTDKHAVFDLTNNTAIIESKTMITPDGGHAIYVIGGETIAVGEVVAIKQTGGADGRVYKCPTTGNELDMPVGVAYTAGSAGAGMWIVVAGIASVLPTAAVTATRGYVITASTTTAGRVDQAATAPAATTHFRELGHFLDTGSGNGAATRAIIHFN